MKCGCDQLCHTKFQRDVVLKCTEFYLEFYAMLTTPRYLDEDEGAVNTHMLSKDPGIAREKMRKRKKSIYREPTKAAFHKLKQKGIVQCIDRPIEVSLSGSRELD